MRGALRWLVLAAAVAGCGGHEGPVSGELSVRLTSPRNGDRAMLFRVVGPQRGVTPAAGSSYRVFADTSAVGDTTWIVVIAPVGTGLASGEIIRLAVNDVRKAGSYRTAVSDIAAADYAVGDTAGVSLLVVKP